MDKRFEKVLWVLMIMAVVGLVILTLWEGNLYGLSRDKNKSIESLNSISSEQGQGSSLVEANDNPLAKDGSSYISSSGLINEHPGILRFHVVANSDSDEDQDLKLKVRDYVLERVQGALAEEIAVNLNANTEQSENERQEQNQDQGKYQNNSNDASADTSSVQDDFEFAMSQNKVIREYVTCKLPLIEKWADEAVELYGYDYDTTASIGIRHIPAKYYDELFFPEGNYEALTISIGEGKGENWWCVVFPPLCLIESAGAGEVDGDAQLVLKSKTKELLNKQNSAEKSNKHTSSSTCSKSINRSLTVIRNSY